MGLGLHVALRSLWLVGPDNNTSLLQNIISFIGLFCKRDLHV